MEKIGWTHTFSWDRGKAISEKENLKLVWEANDPWKLWVSGKLIEDFPYIHAEDWGLAERYALKYLDN